MNKHQTILCPMLAYSVSSIGHWTCGYCLHGRGTSYNSRIMKKLNIFLTLHLALPMAVFVVALIIERCIATEILIDGCLKLQNGWLETWLPATQANCFSSHTVAAYPVIFLLELLCGIALPSYLAFGFVSRKFSPSELTSLHRFRLNRSNLKITIFAIFAVVLGCIAIWTITTSQANIAAPFGRSHYLATPYLQAYTAGIQSVVLIFSTYFVAVPGLIGALSSIHLLKVLRNELRQRAG